MTTHRARELYTNQPGVVIKKSRSGSYNVIEKDYGDHKRIYHVPIEYGENYDLSQLDEPAALPPPVFEEKSQKNSPRLIRRRIYQEYEDDDDDDEDDDYGYVEEVPMVSSRRVHVTPRRLNKETEIIERVYEPNPPARTVEYIYEDDRSNIYEYQPERQEKVEYVVREPAPKPVVRLPRSSFTSRHSSSSFSTSKNLDLFDTRSTSMSRQWSFHRPFPPFVTPHLRTPFDIILPLPFPINGSTTFLLLPRIADLPFTSPPLVSNRLRCV